MVVLTTTKSNDLIYFSTKTQERGIITEESKKYTVYMHINKINNKKYIGITKLPVYKRWGNNGSGYKNNKQLIFYRAIQKYGWDNFEHKILYENLSQEEACNLEIELIKEHKTQDRNFGYNIQAGGQLGNAGITFSEKSKEKMSKSHKGKKLTEEHKKKISEGCKGHKPCVHSEETKAKLREINTGKTLSETTKQKISKTLTGIKRTPETLQKRKNNNPMNVPVYCPEINMTFQTITDAAKYTHAQRSNIQKCLRGERHTAGRLKDTNIKLHWIKS